MSHVLVDFDGTLAVYRGWFIAGEPIEEMVDRVKRWIAEGKDVRIFTARVAPGKDEARQRELVQQWCWDYLGRELPVTNAKDGGTEAIYDDKAFRVEKNTGRVCE